MADTGLVLVGTGAHISGSGEDWSAVSNITAEDNNRAYSDIRKNDGLSDYLRGTNCPFPALPPSSTIDGIEVQFRIQAEQSNAIYDEFIYLVENGSIIANCQNKARPNNDWPGSQYTRTYGSSSDTWGCSLTPSIMNSSTFGVQIMARNDTSSRREARVYWIKIKVYYTEAGATASSGGAGNATADARKHQKAVGSVTGSGDANADTRVAKRAESGSGGTGSANANAKASKHANGDSDGAGGASSEAKVSRRAEGSASEGVGNASAVARLVRRWVAYDDLARRSSRAVPVRSGKVFIRPAGTGSYIDIGYCRIESDGPAAVTVKHALNGRRVIGYNDRLEISWLQTSTAEMAALETLQNSEHDLKISRTRGDDEGGGTEERMYEGYYLQLLPKLQRGKFMMILEKQISVAQMGTRMVVT